MKYKSLLIIFICCFFISDAFALDEHLSKGKTHCKCESHHHLSLPLEVKDGSILSVKDCIAIGLKNSPIIKEEAYRLEIARSNVGVAKSTFFPELSVGAGYRQENNSNDDEFERSYRELPSVGVYLSQMIWDFGKTLANIRMEEFFKIAVQYEFEDSVCSTVFNIKSHYYKLLKAQSEYEAEKINLDIQNNLIKEVKNSVNRGVKTKADLTNAEVELLEIKSKLLIKEDEYKNAQEELNNAMYFENAPKYSIYETQTFQFSPKQNSALVNVSNIKSAKISKDDTVFQHPDYSYEQAVSKAYNNSPDIHALVATRDGMEQSLLAVKRDFYPEINAGVGYDFLKTNEFKNNSFNVGVSIDASVNGMKQKYDVDGAKAQLKLADTQIVTFKKNLYFTVRKCLNTVKTTYANLPITQNKIDKANENLNITINNYKTNKMSELELENARKLYYLSLLDYINSQYEYNIALIKLEMAMHEHLIDYHDDAEHAIKYHQGDENNILKKLIWCKKKHS